MAEATAFKPHVAAYRRAAEILRVRMGEVLFVANYEFDCAGTEAAGMYAAFIDRRRRHFPAWTYQPDLIAPDTAGQADIMV